MMLLYDTAALLLGFLLDLLLGDPQGWPHIVRWYGKLIEVLEKQLYPMANKRLAGGLLVVGVLVIGTGVPLALLALAWTLSPWCYLALASLLDWQCLAARSLRLESLRVYTALTDGTLEDARRAVGMIVGRDTDVLDEAGVARAAVETVAENTSDGEVAPLFYMMLGGPALGCLYKAVNTMDSMVGYRNERYMRFGTCAARLDDVMNYLPSRLSALLMIAAAKLTGADAANALRIWQRDRRKHDSPNSAQTEAVMAGALRVRLAGDARYFGQIHKKQYIGDDFRPIEPEDIRRSHRLLYGTAWLMLLLAVMERMCVYAAL
ncbi:MAG: cobalamin biosynthesis protein CobD [Ruminococcaceae bacterium]|nr:cobalamin biosynthesis protein CobD [Oscillospiraceae bacterium]